MERPALTPARNLTVTRQSAETMNRVISWQTALRDSLAYIQLADYFMGKRDLGGIELPYTHGRNSWHDIALTTQRGLVQAAVVMYRHPFTSGASGDGIADNHSPEVRAVLEDMETLVKQSLGWSDDEYRQFNGQIRDQRNKFLAHLDGSRAKVTQLSQSWTSMRPPGAHLDPDEREKLVHVLLAMLTFLDELVLGHPNA